MKLFSTVVVIVGIVQGLFIGSALLIDKTYSSKNIKYLGLTIVFFSLQGILDLLSFWDIGSKYLGAQIATYFGFQGIIFLPYFLSVLSSLRIKFFMPLWLLFVPFILSVINGIICSIITLLGKKDTLWDVFYLDELWSFHWVLNILLVLFLNIYLLKLVIKVPNSTNKKGALSLLISFSIVISLWIVINILNYFFNSDFYYLLTLTTFWGTVTLFIFWLTYKGVVQQRLTNEQKSLHIILKEKEIKVSSTYKKEDATDNNYYNQFLQLLTEQKIYRDKDINRNKVAQKLNISAGYFSKIINKASNQSFIEIINEHRVKEVMEILSDGRLNHFSLTAIGLEVGFKSKSTFFTNFKKITGSTPKEYKEKNQS